MNIIRPFIKLLCDYFHISCSEGNRYVFNLVILLSITTVGSLAFVIESIWFNNPVLILFFSLMLLVNFISFALVRLKQYFNLAIYVYLISYNFGVGYLILNGGENSLIYMCLLTVPVLNVSLLEIRKATIFNSIFAIVLLVVFQFPDIFWGFPLDYSSRLNMLLYFVLLSGFLLGKEFISAYFRQKSQDEEQGLASFLELNNNLLNQVSDQIKHMSRHISKDSKRLKKETSRTEMLKIIGGIQESSAFLINMSNSLVEHTGRNKIMFEHKKTFSLYEKLSKILKLVGALGEKIELRMDESLPANIHSNLFVLGQVLFGIIYKQTFENKEPLGALKVLVKKGKETSNSLEIKYLLVKYIGDDRSTYEEINLQRLGNYDEATLRQIGVSNLAVLVGFLDGEMFYDKTDNHDVIGFSQVLPKDKNFDEQIVQDFSYEFATFNRGNLDQSSFDKQIRKKLKNMRVLVMENNMITQKAVVSTLRKIVRDIDVAFDGKEGFDMFLRKKYDLVLVDVNMPISSGKEVVSRIRNIEEGTTTRVPIIALTLEYQPSTAQDVLNAGADGWITKPFIIKEFFVKMDQIFFNLDKQNRTV